MKNHSIRWLSLVVLFASGSLSNQASASFHVMQIEQVIGGVNGDTTAQAIQLRLRSGGQNQLQFASLRTVDAAGANEVLLDNMGTSVTDGTLGSRVLITTPNFANYTDIPLVSDFTMVPIPVSYLAAGQLTFENSSGSVTYWSLSWGGSGFTGSTLANSGITNDDDGDYGPPVDGALPSNSLSALLFQGIASAKSKKNVDDYVLTSGAATFINNAGTEFTLVADPADFNGDNVVDGEDFLIWQRGFGSPGGLSDGDANNDGNVDGDDLAIWESQYGLSIPLSGISAIPEPQSICLLLWGLLALSGRRRVAS